MKAADAKFRSTRIARTTATASSTKATSPVRFGFLEADGADAVAGRSPSAEPSPAEATARVDE